MNSRNYTSVAIQPKHRQPSSDKSADVAISAPPTYCVAQIAETALDLYTRDFLKTVSLPAILQPGTRAHED
jgi:hypothetical protein